MFEIVSFGDVTTLNTVFNAIAAISANSTYKAGAAALALFVFMASMLGSMSDGKQDLPIGRLLGAFFLYIVGFSTLTSVSIENRYDGTVTTIDNIPIAIAVPASLFSSIGFELTELVETAFGSTNEYSRITERGYLSPLSHIAAYRGIIKQSCPLGNNNTALSGLTICPSMMSYMRDCGMVKAKRDGLEQMFKQSDFIEAIKFDSKAFTTILTMANGAQQELTCSSAYAMIKTAYSSPDFERALNTQKGALGVRPTEDVIDQTRQAMAAIQADSAASRQMLQTIYSIKVAEEGELAFYSKMGTTDLAENLNSSIEMRNFDWAMQGEMWVQIVNKFLAILEAMLYAITPFIGLMALCGSVGGKSVVLYLQMIAVMQIIPPMLVVTGNIIMNQLAIEITILEQQYDVGSINYVHALLSKVQELMGLGGMIAATVVPALAMSLVTGSGMAVMGALKGAAATAKDTDSMPDSVGQGGSIQDLSSLNTGSRDTYGNSMSQQSLTTLGDITKSTGASVNVSGAKTKMDAAQEAYATARGNMFQTSSGARMSTDEVIKAGHSINNSMDNSQEWSDGFVRQHSQGAGLTKHESAQLQGLMAVSGMLNGTGASLSAAFMTGLSTEVKQAYNELTTGSKGEAIAARFQEGKDYSESKGKTISTGNDELDSQFRKIENTQQEVKSTTNQYQEAQSASATISMINSDVRGGLFHTGGDEGVQAKLAEGLAEKQGDTDYNRGFAANYQVLTSGGSNDLDHDSAMLAAYIMTNNQMGDPADSLEVLSAYEPNQLSSPSDLAGKSFGVVDKIGKTPGSGDIKRVPIRDPETNTVPTFHTADAMTRSNLTPQEQEQAEVAQVARIKDAEVDAMEQHKTDTAEVNEAQTTADQRFDVIKDYVESQEIKGTAPLNAAIGVASLLYDFSTAGMLENVLDGASVIYDTAMAAYNGTPTTDDGEAKQQITKSFQTLSEYIKEVGSDSPEAGEATKAFAGEVGSSLVTLLSDEPPTEDNGVIDKVVRVFDNASSSFTDSANDIAAQVGDYITGWFSSDESDKATQSVSPNEQNQVQTAPVAVTPNSELPPQSDLEKQLFPTGSGSENPRVIKSEKDSEDEDKSDSSVNEGKKEEELPML